MRLKKIFILVLVFIGFQSIGQNPASKNGYSVMSFSPQLLDLEELKSKELIFFLKPNETPFWQDYHDRIGESWSISNVRVLRRYQELDSLWINSSNDRLFLTITDATSNSQLDKTLVTHFPYLSLWAPCRTESGYIDKTKLTTIAKIPLLIDRRRVDIRKLITDAFKFGHQIKPHHDVHYEKEEFYNWHPGYIALYLRMIERALKNDEHIRPYGPNQFDNSRAKSLKEMVLHIPDYALDRLKSTDLTVKKKREEGDIFESYDWTYEVNHSDRLYVILNGDYSEQDCLLFPQWSGLSIIHIQSGAVLFHSRYHARFKPAVYSSDIAELAKFVRMESIDL